MSRANHPAGRARVCSMPDCTEQPQARVVFATGPSPIVPNPFVTVLPLGHGNGNLTCLDHVHHLVDVMLLRATPEPTR